MFGGFSGKQAAGAALQGAGGMKSLQGLAGQLMQREMMKNLFGDMSLAPPPTPQTPTPGQQGGPQGGGMGVPAPQAPMGPGAQQRPMPGGPMQKPTPQGLGALIGGSGAPGVNPAQLGNHQTSLTPPPGQPTPTPPEQVADESFGKRVGGGDLPDPNAPPDPLAGVEPDHDQTQGLMEQLEYWENQPDGPEKAQALEDIRQAIEQLKQGQ